MTSSVSEEGAEPYSATLIMPNSRTQGGGLGERTQSTGQRRPARYSRSVLHLRSEEYRAQGMDKGRNWTASTSFRNHAQKHGARQSRATVFQEDISRDHVREDRKIGRQEDTSMAE